MATRNPMTWSAAVLSSVSSDTEPTIVITFDNAKYIFNAGENTNRSFLQSKYNWKRTQGIFFTQLGTQRASGLAGLLMTFADATIKNLDIVGPPGLTHYLGTMRTYTYRESMAVTPFEVPIVAGDSATPEPVFKDQMITVYGIPVLPTDSSSSIMVQDTPLKRKREQSPDAPSKRQATDDEPAIQAQQAELPLARLMQKPDFIPTSLTRDLANDWKRLVVKTMFPYAGIRPGPRENRDEVLLKQNPKRAAGDARAHQLPRPQISNFFESMPPLEPSIAIPNSKLTTRPVLAYVIVGPRIRGKFNAEQAEALQIPHGAERAKLTSGQSITITVDGVEKVIHPHDVMAPAENPCVAIIVDVPTVNHIQSLVSSFTDHPFYRKFRADRNDQLVVRSIFHLCGDQVLADPRYIDFMNGFGPDVQHIIASREYCADPVTFTSAAYNLLRLNQLDSKLFTIPRFCLSKPKELRSLPNLPEKSYLMISSSTVDIRPSAPPALHRINTIDQFHVAATNNFPLAIESATLQSFNEAKDRIAAAEKESANVTGPGADVVVLPLGTGSALPTKYRNVSSTLIQIPNYGNILLDAGEGTWGQLSRHFGVDTDRPNNVWDVLRNLKCIYLSHIHGDHHMGVAQILSKRRQLDPPPTTPLYLVTLHSIHIYLRELSQLEDLGLTDEGNGVITVMAEALHWKKGDYPDVGRWRVHGNEPWRDIETSRAREKELCAALGLESFKTVDVRHQTKCYGAVIKHTDNWSIVFSADTQPSDNLVYAGQGATLLIHEATMADDQIELAEKKAHSTVGQAMAIAKRMNARNLLLTHFSARYPKMPPYIEGNDAGILGVKANVGLAFDNGGFRIGDMWKLGYYHAALQANFAFTAAEEGDLDEENDVSGVLEVNIG
ncbi:hypothetical protein C8J56DRAFT_1173192 [Mycena floridula]|nr:hypothetical protein C8J56DRAFT_1173192 [Mycena floridula]